MSHIRSIILLPGMVAIVIPGIIVWRSGRVNTGWGLPLPWSAIVLLLGVLLILAGLVLMVQTVSLFITVGKGTLAPWEPTQKLVVQGVYRYVRNPMISGVASILLGESVFVGSVHLLNYFLFFLLLNLIYIPLLEEPGLQRRFGEDYVRYKQNVPRWIPRRKPWSGD